MKGSHAGGQGARRGADVRPVGRPGPEPPNAPVFDADGTVVVVLCLVCATGDGGMSVRAGFEILQLGDRVRAAADSLAAATHGRPPASRGA
ncbi:hypothetical protein [Pseudofrankia sp. BMG5.36]|uniref:hypothetical protein n=1 Tax=Pseudofrankia sp. BMG5.36 TaxID=1834512 RepID=UPI0008D93497|nr:hypothetical protein [Pseudofrankia sp. BMG5.36]OHV62267.1 hypothetical protein BCD48_39370 [Pseudofrankia sp. BMG5.36]